MDSTARQPLRQCRARVADGGRLVIPVEFRRELGIGDGQDVVVFCEGSEIRIITLEEAIRKVQAYFSTLGPPDVVWSEALSRDRREETAKEEID